MDWNKIFTEVICDLEEDGSTKHKKTKNQLLSLEAPLDTALDTLFLQLDTYNDDKKNIQGKTVE